MAERVGLGPVPKMAALRSGRLRGDVAPLGVRTGPPIGAASFFFCNRLRRRPEQDGRTNNNEPERCPVLDGCGRRGE